MQVIWHIRFSTKFYIWRSNLNFTFPWLLVGYSHFSSLHKEIYVVNTVIPLSSHKTSISIDERLSQIKRRVGMGPDAMLIGKADNYDDSSKQSYSRRYFSPTTSHSLCLLPTLTCQLYSQDSEQIPHLNHTKMIFVSWVPELVTCANSNNIWDRYHCIINISH